MADQTAQKEINLGPYPAMKVSDLMKKVHDDLLNEVGSDDVLSNHKIVVNADLGKPPDAV